MPTIHDSAVCIRRLDWSETSQIVVLMTRDHGKISAAAKGAKRQTPSTMAKFSGGVDLMSQANAVIIVKSGSDLATLIEWDLVEPFWHLRQSLGAHRYALYAADLIHHLIQDHDAHPATFEALSRFLAALSDVEHHARSLLQFQWDLTVDLGFRPVLDRDAQTSEPLIESSTYAFSSTAGGLVADTGGADRWRVRAETVHLLRLQEASALIEVETETIERANRLLCVYLRSILDRQLPTMRYILDKD